MLFLQITQMVLPVLAAMAIGFFCRRSGLLNAQGHAALKTVIGNITLPVVLFNAFLTAEYNGYYGKVTKQAVMDFQKSAGLTADGICGPDTWKALFGEN